MGTGWSQGDEASLSQPQKIIAVETRDPNNSGNNVVNGAKGVGDAKPSGNGNNISKKQSEEKRKAGIHNLDSIIEKADSSLHRLSPENIQTQLEDGIYFNQKRQRYWIDKKKRNCFMVYARDLSIVWGDDNRYWIWHPANDHTSDEGSIEVTELLNVCWLEVRGKFDTKNLSPDTNYQVSFVVMLKQQAYGWDSVNPVNVVLNLPDGSEVQQKVNVALVQPKEQWTDLPVGIFKTMPQNQQGDITFSLHEYRGGVWKRGLVIKGVKIRPS